MKRLSLPTMIWALGTLGWAAYAVHAARQNCLARWAGPWARDICAADPLYDLMQASRLPAAALALWLAGWLVFAMRGSRS